MGHSHAVSVFNLSKVYKMYGKPTDRVLEALRLTGRRLYTEFNALSGVSFSLEKGEILGIMGRNGSGKSTLLKIITGVLTPTYGTVDVNGRMSSLLELGAGFNMEYTGIENIYFYSTLMGLTSSQTDARLHEIVSFAEIGDYIHQPVKTYSSGMFARLAFACAIHVDPDILIVDEILSVGDIRFQAKCFNRFREFKKQGVTIIYVGHDISLMRSFCDTCMWLNNGKIVELGDPTYVSSKYVEFMYVDALPDFTSYKMDDDKKQDSPEAGGNLPEEDTVPQLEKSGLFPQSIAHWGSCTGLIRSVEILNEQGTAADYFSPHEKISVSVTFAGSGFLDYETLSAAISVKNKEGIDVIVKTTFDEGVRISRAAAHRVTFSLKTMLAPGDYYLVAALETRKNAVPIYYEYVDGALYFKIFTEKRIFGMFDAESGVVAQSLPNLL